MLIFTQISNYEENFKHNTLIFIKFYFCPGKMDDYRRSFKSTKSKSEENPY